MRRFEYFAPQSLAEAIALFGEKGEGGRALAGGTDLVPQIKEGGKIPMPSYLVSLRRLPELRGIEFSESNGLRIGAGVTMAELAESPVVRERYRALADGAGVVGSVQTMNMATVGGNVCNAAPSADTAPALLAYEAVAVIAGPDGERELPLAEFWRGPNATALQPGELLRQLRLPVPPPNTGGVYVRRTPRKQMDIAVVGVAVLLTLDPSTGSGQSGDRIRQARVALGAVAPTAIRARQAEAALEGQPAGESVFAKAAQAAAAEARPISDQRGSAEFRRHLVRVTTERCLQEAARRAGEA
ncbi:MAG: xanthine dehydrogenase family protein subunit M [Dehalococcoidia bacterium]|nr:xanthine dehydrogenase family protein subunit M [Dehalococcoidia bacterium]